MILLAVSLLELLGVLVLCLMLYLCVAHWLAFYEILIPPFTHHLPPFEEED